MKNSTDNMLMPLWTGERYYVHPSYVYPSFVLFLYIARRGMPESVTFGYTGPEKGYFKRTLKLWWPIYTALNVLAALIAYCVQRL